MTPSISNSSPYRRLFVTGGAGFIGSNFLRSLLSGDPTVEVTNYDLLTYAGNPDNVADLPETGRYEFIHGDVSDFDRLREAVVSTRPDAIVNFAAESHVDRSIVSASAFLRTNIDGTQCILDVCRAEAVRRLVHVSTDEVYGEVVNGESDERAPLCPSSPYSASKASAELLCAAAHRTHGIDVVITRGSNTYGPYQFPEKLIPLALSHALRGEDVPIYADGQQERDWIHVDDHCDAIALVTARGVSGEVYNIATGNRTKNLDLVRLLLSTIGAEERLIRHVADRPGHDRRYAPSPARMRDAFGWRARRVLTDEIDGVASWYRDHSEWIERIRSGAYQA